MKRLRSYLIVLFMGVSCFLGETVLAEGFMEEGAGMEGFQAEDSIEPEENVPVLEEAQSAKEDPEGDIPEEEETSLEEIPVDEVHFPDEVFRKMISRDYDTDQSGSLSLEERQQMTKFSLSQEKEGNIYSFRGIEYFPELERFVCSGIPLQKLDMSSNPKLSVLYLRNCPNLHEIVVEKNLKLREFDLSDTTGLETLELSGFPELRLISAGATEKVTLKNLPVLEHFYADWAKEINISDCEKLDFMEIWDNESRDGDLETLDVSRIPSLRNLTIHGFDRLKTMDFRENPNLTHVRIDFSGLEGLEVAEDNKITSLNLEGNKIKSLDLTRFPRLGILEISGNEISSIDLSPCKDTLGVITCSTTNIKYLDISELWNLRYCRADKDCEIFGIKEPKLQKARLVKNDQVELTWEKDRTADEYRIERKNLEGEWELLETRWQGEGTKFTQKVTPGRSYTYRVIARRFVYDDEDWYDSTASEEGISTPTLFNTPVMKSVIRTAKHTVKVKWQGVKGATKYRIYRRRTGGRVWRNLGDVKGTAFTDKKAPAGTTYCYTVKAYNENTKPVMISRYPLNGMQEAAK